MRVVTKVAVMGALLLPLATVPASAQSWKVDWNVNGGYSHYSTMLNAENTGINSISDNDVKFKNGGLLGSQLTFWLGNKLGLRFNGTYADRPVVSSAYTLFSPAASGINHVNLWSGSADLMFRFASPAAEFTKMEVLPYLALGAGAKWHNPAGDNYTCNDTQESKSWACAPFTVQNGGTNGNSFALAEANSIMGLGGLGADWRLSRTIAIRTEVGDRVYKPKIQQLASATVLGNTITTLNTADGDKTVSRVVNELYGQVGLGFLFGVARPAAVAIAPAPVAPAPAPAPAPTISREPLSVCVVDPTATGGLRMQSAYLVGGRDTVVVANGSDQPFTTAIGTVPTAASADWYVRGQPLTITWGTGTTNRVEFATYGSARNINSSDLAYLGTINGMPVYADRNDVSPWITEWTDASRSNADIGTVLGNQSSLRTQFQNVKVLYVPMATSGCVFQAVQRQEEVRKSGK
jgi:hypothetical protein